MRLRQKALNAEDEDEGDADIYIFCNIYLKFFL